MYLYVIIMFFYAFICECFFGGVREGKEADCVLKQDVAAKKQIFFRNNVKKASKRVFSP